MSKGTVVIKETMAGTILTNEAGEYVGEEALARFTATWPSGKVFEKYVDAGDAVNERVRQERFAEERGYEVEWDMKGSIIGLD